MKRRHVAYTALGKSMLEDPRHYQSLFYCEVRAELLVDGNKAEALQIAQAVKYIRASPSRPRLSLFK